jgi:hypothetical protein
LTRQPDSRQGQAKPSKPPNPNRLSEKNFVPIKLDFLFYLIITFLFLISNLEYFMIAATPKNCG